MALAGFIGVTAYFYFENNGVKLSNASTASIIVAAIPIITLLADALFFGYKLSKKAVLGVALSLAGVYFVVGADLGQLFTSGQGKGNLLMFGAVLSWVVYCMVTRSIYRKYSQLAITCYQNVFGAVTLIPFALLEKTPWQQIDANIMLNVAFLGVFCSAVGYYFYIYAMSTLGVSVTSLFINLSPVVTVAASYLLLNETITKTQLGGGLLVLLSVYLVSFSGPQPEQEQTGTISLAE
ncbi:MAG TPA: DMT family transporter, partial [Bacillota bacterium]|nr:DMT family transporter [Bacillota bacterium]